MKILPLNSTDLARIKIIQGMKPLSGKISFNQEVVNWMISKLLSMNMELKKVQKDLQTKETYIEHLTGKKHETPKQTIPKAPIKKT